MILAMSQTHTPKIIDLTKPLDGSLMIFRSGDYADPPFRSAEWCSVEGQGYRVSRLEMGTQTGTHIDAPAHFLTGGATLDILPVDRLIGEYFLIDLPKCCDLDAIQALSAGYVHESILFLRTGPTGITDLTTDALSALVALPPLVWVLAGVIAVAGAPDLTLHRVAADAGKYLIEDLHEENAALVPRRGEIFALPLRLIGTSGAPCRVVVRAAVQPE